MSGYIGSPWTRDRTTMSKSGSNQMTGANPDFCIRYNAKRSLRVVGEVKFLPRTKTSPSSVEKATHEIRHYLSIESSSHSDWGHDIGIGIVYCGADSTPRHAELIQNAWEQEKIAIAYFHA